jgi:outer membrane protein assembly factor BamE (lipoprotein component of BamABCDE complex)|tara:strand:- start:160 stop:621 length:462 start_codon:yes stop_codon:yes gene_type:complete
MSFGLKNHFNLFLLSVFFILISCKLQEPTKNHGILFLKNRADKLTVNVSNKNDVLSIIGNPHSKSISNDDDWIYIERVLTKGEFLKLGQNVLKTNNVLVLSFDKYGVLKEKYLIDKNDKNKLTFTEKTTENKLSQASFIEKFLQSLKTKMYKK